MAESFDPENMDKFVKNLKAAQQFSKDVNAGFSEWENASKQIKEYSDAIKNKTKLIAELTERAAAAKGKEKDELEAQIALEEEKLKTNQAQLKLLRKQVSLTKTLGNEAIKAVKGLAAQIPNLLTGFYEMDGASRRMAVNLGMGSTRMKQFQVVAANSAEQLTLMGLEAKASAEMMAAYTEETGRQTMLGKQAVVGMGALAQRTGMAHGEMAGLAGQMESFGMGGEEAVASITEMADMADKMGVNTSKVMKKIQQNIKMVNKFSFKGGVKGLASMVAKSEKFKFSMESIAGMAEKAFRPEGAIDMAANLQVLGGGLSKLGDPFKLMYEARNNPEEFAMSLVKATDAVAVFDKKTGAFEVNALQLDRLKEAAEATGVPLEELVQMSKQAAKQSMFKDALKIDGEQGEFLQGIAEMKDGKAQIAIGVDAEGNKKYKELKNMSKSDQMFYADKLKKEKESNEEAALRAQSTMELLKNMMNSLMAKLYPVILKLDEVLRPILIDLYHFVKDSVFPIVMKALNFLGPKGILATYLIFKAAPWILRGRMLGLGFNMTAGKGGIIKRLFGGRGGQSAAASAAGPLTKSGRPDMRYNANKGMGAAGVGKGAQGAGAMGQSAGSQAKNMIAGAAAILILSAALFVFAKALQEFEKLQNGWATLFLAAGSLLVLAGALKIMEPTLNSFGKGSWPGIAAMAALAVSVMALGYATTLFAQGGFAGTMLMIVALAALTIAIAVLGGLGISGIGFIGVALILALGVAMIAMGFAVKLAAEGMSMLVDSFTGLFSVVNLENMAAMFMLGPALSLASIGILAMAASLVVMGAALMSPFGLLGLIGLATAAYSLKDAFGDVDARGITEAVTAVNSVNKENIDALKSLSAWLAFAGNNIKIDFGDIDINGALELKGNQKTVDLVFEEPNLTKLKDLIWDSMEKGKGGGKL